MTAPLSGIWNYKGRQVTTNGPLTGQNESGPFTVPAQQLEALASGDPAMQKLIDEGILTRVLTQEAQSGQNEGGAFNLPAIYDYQIDYSRLPATKYGSLLDMRQIDIPSGNAVGGFKIKDPRYVYDDPNYGRITPTWNTVDPSKQRNVYDMIGPLVMGAVLGGAGMGFFGPTAAGQGTALGVGRGALGALQSGNWGSALGSAAGGMSGLPFGSTLGNIAGGMAQSALRSPQQMPTQRTGQSQLTPQQAYLLLALLSRRG